MSSFFFIAFSLMMMPTGAGTVCPTIADTDEALTLSQALVAATVFAVLAVAVPAHAPAHATAAANAQMLRFLPHASNWLSILQPESPRGICGPDGSI
jgi:hypothetical protein